MTSSVSQLVCMHTRAQIFTKQTMKFSEYWKPFLFIDFSSGKILLNNKMPFNILIQTLHS